MAAADGFATGINSDTWALHPEDVDSPEPLAGDGASVGGGARVEYSGASEHCAEPPSVATIETSVACTDPPRAQYPVSLERPKGSDDFSSRLLLLLLLLFRKRLVRILI